MSRLKPLLREGYFRGITLLGVQSILLRRANPETLFVLNLHRVSPQRNPYWPPLEPYLFEDLVSFLTRHCTVTTFARLHEDARESSRPLAILSFDDGYRDFVEYAMPVLDRFAIPANQNLIGHCLTSGEPPWMVALYDRLNAAPPFALRRLRLPGFNARWPRDDAEKERFGASLTNFLKSTAPNARDALRQEVEAALGSVEVKEPTRMMSRADVRTAIDAGHEIGTNSYSHESMARVSDEHFLSDLERSLQLTSDLGGNPAIYAFPNGSYREPQIGMLRDRGVEHVLLVGERPSRVSNGVHTRITVRGRSRSEVRLRALGHRPPLGS